MRLYYGNNFRLYGGMVFMTVRPLQFEDYIGQERIKTQLQISIGASKRMGKQLPHVLLHGNPGLGKTTLAQIISNELGVKFHEVMASNLTTVEDVESILANLSDNDHGEFDVLFIDEIHRLSPRIEEMFYPVMEDFVFERDIADPRTNRKELKRFWVPKFTLIGATTQLGDISRPMRDRFGLKFQLQNYAEAEIVTILEGLAGREKVQTDKKALFEIARRSKGVARIAINYFNRCREYADFKVGDGLVDSDVCMLTFDLMGIDEMGLEEVDYSILGYLASQSRPVGLDTLSTACDIDKNTIANIIEPYLLQTGLINKGGRGREITDRGLAWIMGKDIVGFDFNEPREVAEQQQEQPRPTSSGDITRVGRG